MVPKVYATTMMRLTKTLHRAGVIILLAWGCGSTAAAGETAGQDRFVNFESPQVHPIDLSPGGHLLAACNSANGTVDLFDVDSGEPAFLGSVAVGVDPASVRFRTDGELWVTNWISDSISVVDVEQRSVVRTLLTLDEPADVVFASGKAFVTCSQPDTLLVFSLADLDAAAANIRVKSKFPRALAVGGNGKQVFALSFQSGNKSTLLAHDFIPSELQTVLPERVVSRPDGPHGGQNPPFNGDGQFVPALAPGLPPPPPTDLIVKQDAGGTWRDDTGADWSEFVSGTKSKASGRVPGWHLPDRDVVVVDAETLAVTYVSGLMNMCMGIAVQPGTGRVTVVGTDALNEVRYEPNLTGRMVKSLMAFVQVGEQPRVVDLNAGHLDYAAHRVAPELRALSSGDPRGVAWNGDGTLAWVAGMGSNNLVPLTPDGVRPTPQANITVAAGPTGLVLHPKTGRLFVLCRFAAEVNTVDPERGTVVARTPLFDPTPESIRLGRPLLYDTVSHSGLGQASCGSCHVDARTDGLAWDLGDPQGSYRSSENRNVRRESPHVPAEDFHPMKGPRTTQTLQDIIGHEPFHWSGDRDGLESFSGAFKTLMGDDEPLAEAPMAEMKDFLASIVFPPNPYRNLDNSLPEHLDLSFTPGLLEADGTRPEIPAGNPRHGLEVFLTGSLSCALCHTLPSGRGTPLVEDHYRLVPVARGPHGERDLRVSIGANTDVQTMYKMPPLAPLYEKMGLDFLSADGSTTGFGFFSSGAIDSLFRFALSMQQGQEQISFQDRVDLFALMLVWGGSDMPRSQSGTPLQPPGMAGHDSHAALGQQATIRTPKDDLTRLVTLRNVVEQSDRVELVAKGRRNGAQRGWWYHDGHFIADAPDAYATLAELVDTSGPGSETTFTVVGAGTGRRLGIDRDLDGNLDGADSHLAPVALRADGAATADGDCPECEASTRTLRDGEVLCLEVDDVEATAFAWSKGDEMLSDGQRVRGAFCNRLRISAVTQEDAGTYRVDYVGADKVMRHELFEVAVEIPGIPALAPIALAAVFALLGAGGAAVLRRRR